MIEALLALIGPVWFGLQGSPYWLVLAWALVSVAWCFWRSRDSVIHAMRQGGEVSTATVFFPVILSAMFAIGFIAVHSAVFYLAGGFG
ncbi:MAG: hypothetical protein K8S25_08705 [Alphaproteobacteria bacterium]|nr:hypothetical protein [Alphaproteobacteria bacterium]